MACSSFPRNKETVCPGNQFNLPNGGGMGPPKFLWSPKLLTSVGRSREQDLREGPPCSRQHLFRVCFSCLVTNDLQKSGTFLQLSLQSQLLCPANPQPGPPPPIHTLVVNTVTSSSSEPSPPHHDSGHPCHLQTRWSHLVLYLQLCDLPLYECAHLFGGLGTAPK